MRGLIAALLLVGMHPPLAYAQAGGQVLTNPTVNGGVLNGTAAGAAVVTVGGTTQAMSGWLSSFVPIGGASADLGPASGSILGVWPNLYFAPSPDFTGMPTVSGATTSQIQFIRNGTILTYVGAANNFVGISSAENLPITLSNNNYQTRIFVDPMYGNVGIGTITPAARLDVAAQSIVIEQSNTPPTSTSACTTGMISWDASYIYVCTAANTWKRSALGAF